MTTTSKPTLVLGATDNPARYAYLAATRLQAAGHPVYLLGSHEGKVGDAPIMVGKPALNNVDTVTLYLRPERQEEYYDYIIGLHPHRIVFNPGTENPALIKLAEQHGIETEIACTLVMLSIGNY